MLAVRKAEEFLSLPKGNYFSLAFFTILVFGLYGHNAAGFWRADDTSILFHMLRYSPLSGFIDPAIWVEFSGSNLTPWLPLSYRLDYLLAGLNPRVFYIHQLLVLALTAWSGWHLLSLYTGKLTAFIGMLFFIPGIPVAIISSQLMTRHYLEGLLFCILGLWQFERSGRGRETYPFLLALLFFGLAATAKEIYVPCGLALVLASVIHEKDQRARIATFLRLSPYLMLSLVYIAWRAYMLPALVGGYADTSSYLSYEFWISVLQTFLSFPTLLLSALGWPLTILALGLITFRFWRKPRGFLYLLVWAGAIMAPLIPLVAYPGINSADRYLFSTWFGFCCLLAFGLDAVLNAIPAIMNKQFGCTLTYTAAFIALFMLLMQLQQFQLNLRSDNQRTDAQMRFVWDNSDAVAFLPDDGIASSFWMTSYALRIKQLSDPTASIPYPLVDELFLQAGRPLYVWDEICRCMTPDEVAAAQMQQRLLTRLQPQADLEVTLNNDHGYISWTLGPYERGTYYLVSEDIGKRVLPRTMTRLRTNIVEPVNLYVKYESEEGWMTYSDTLEMTTDGVSTAWQRRR